MIRVFDKIFDHIQHRPQRKKVEQYLHDTTPCQSKGWRMIHHHKFYWVGAPEGTKTGVHIVPKSRMATLRTATTSNESEKSGRYKDIGVEWDGDDAAGLEEEFPY